MEKFPKKWALGDEEAPRRDRFSWDFSTFVQIPGWTRQAWRAKNFLRILEHAGQLLNKFQAVPLTRSRDLGFLKLKNFPKVGPRRRRGPSAGPIFVDFCEIFPLSSSFRARKATPSHQNFFAHTRACGATPEQVSGCSLN